jgi:hypothetical protein
MTALASGPWGLQYETLDIIVTNRTGGSTVVGTPYKLDLTCSDGDVTDNAAGASDSGLANIIAVDDDDVEIVGIALDAVADNKELRLRLKGRVQALVNGGVTIGQPLEPAAADLQLLQVGGQCCGYCLVAPGTADALEWVLFDGLNGFGGGNPAT